MVRGRRVRRHRRSMSGKPARPWNGPAGTMIRRRRKRPCCSGRGCARRDRRPPAWETWRNKPTKHWLPKSVTCPAGCMPAQRSPGAANRSGRHFCRKRNQPLRKRTSSEAGWNRCFAYSTPASFPHPIHQPRLLSVIPAPHPPFPRKRESSKTYVPRGHLIWYFLRTSIISQTSSSSCRFRLWRRTCPCPRHPGYNPAAGSRRLSGSPWYPWGWR